jgi:hypothetical protein
MKIIIVRFSQSFIFCPQFVFVYVFFVDSSIHAAEGRERRSSRERIESSENGKRTGNSSTEGSTTTPTRPAGPTNLI